jgi:hypothetical protein
MKVPEVGRNVNESIPWQLAKELAPICLNEDGMVKEPLMLDP